MSHALVVGGTGMLRGLTLALAQEFDWLSVLAKTPQRLTSLADAATRKNIRTICIDWANSQALRAHLNDAVNQCGTLALTVCWIHSTAPEAPMIVADAVSNPQAPCRYFQIFGSPSDANRSLQRHWQKSLSARAGIDYRCIVLGSKTENGTRRWLTDQEICTGTQQAIASDALHTLIGDH